MSDCRRLLVFPEKGVAGVPLDVSVGWSNGEGSAPHTEINDDRISYTPALDDSEF